MLRLSRGVAHAASALRHSWGCTRHISTDVYDVAIVGAGVVGATLACSIGKETDGGHPVVLSNRLFRS